MFRSRCWYVLSSQKTKKLTAHTREAIMIGYSFVSKDYKLWDPDLKKVIISRSVKCDEENIHRGTQTDGIDEVHTVPTVRITSPVEFSSPSIDSQTSESKNDNQHESDSILRRLAAVPTFEDLHAFHVPQGSLALKLPTPQIVRIKTLNTPSIIAVIFPVCIHLTSLNLPSPAATLPHIDPFSLH